MDFMDFMESRTSETYWIDNSQLDWEHEFPFEMHCFWDTNFLLWGVGIGLDWTQVFSLKVNNFLLFESAIRSYTSYVAGHNEI